MSVPASLMMSQFQGMSPSGNLMSGAPGGIQIPSLLNSSLNPQTPGVGGNPLLSQMGPWSKLAYQMAGSPLQGPYPNVPVPASSGGAGSTTLTTAGGAGGLLGSLMQNPSLAKTAVNTISGLLSPGVGTPAWEAAITSGTSAGIPAASAIAAPTAADVGASIGAPVGGDLYAGAQGAASSGAILPGIGTDIAAAPPAAAGAAGAADAGAGSAASSAAGSAGSTASTAGSLLGIALPLAATGWTADQLWNTYQNDPKQAAVDMMNSLQNVDPALYRTLYQAYQSGGPDAIATTMGGLFNPYMQATPGTPGSGYRPQGHPTVQT